MRRTLEIDDEVWAKIKQLATEDDRSAASVFKRMMRWAVDNYDPSYHYNGVAKETSSEPASEPVYRLPWDEIPPAANSVVEGTTYLGQHFDWNRLRQGPADLLTPNAIGATHPSGKHYTVDLEQGLWWPKD